MKFYPYKRGQGDRKSFSHADGGEGGVTKNVEVVLTQELEVLAIVMGGGQTKFLPMRGGGGGAKSFTLS